MDYLLRRIIGWKQLPLFDRFANDAVQRLNGVVRVDHFSSVLRVVEQRVEILPIGTPGAANLGVCCPIGQRIYPAPVRLLPR